jgi:phage terminase large subunit-like protein
MKWSTACLDWEERILARESLIPLPPLFPDEAEAALKVFKSLRVVDLPGRPTFGEVSEPFVFDFVRAIFGAYDAKAAKRLISEFMLLISKKNTKSTLAAGIMLTALLRNWREMAELIILAPTIKVAGNSFKPAAAMVRADPRLTEMLQVVDHERTIRHRITLAELRVVAADSGTLGGIKAGFILVDELWLFGKKSDAEGMFEEASGGMASRPEGFIVYLTTHSDEPPAGVFRDKLDYFRDVRDGKIDDPTTLGMLYEWPEKLLEQEAYLKPEFFYVTNPMIGRSTSAEFIEGKLRKAARGEIDTDEDTGSLQVVLAKYLNVEIGVRLRRDRWRGADDWAGCADPSLTLEALLARCEVAVIGVDGGGRDDLYGLCVAGRERETNRWLYWFRAWCWPEVLRRRKNIADTLRGFARDGDMVLCDEDVLEAIEDDDGVYRVPQDIREIVEVIVTVRESGLLPEKGAIGLDPAGVADLVDELEDAGITADQLVAVSQGWSLQSAIVGLARRLRAKGARHNGTRLMDWCVANAKEETTKRSVGIVKYASGKAKIDPLMAGFNATKLLENNPVAGGSSASVYAERGLIVI